MLAKLYCFSKTKRFSVHRKSTDSAQSQGGHTIHYLTKTVWNNGQKSLAEYCDVTVRFNLSSSTSLQMRGKWGNPVRFKAWKRAWMNGWMKQTDRQWDRWAQTQNLWPQNAVNGNQITCSQLDKDRSFPFPIFMLIQVKYLLALPGANM